MIRQTFILTLITAAVLSKAVYAQSGRPHLTAVDGVTRLMVDGRPFIMLAGELHNSSASSSDYMASVWPRLAEMNLNTVIAPVYWELTEPEEGKFDFSLVDDLIAAARAHNLRLVLLWFASWKNTESTYAPVWVKRDTQRFFRALTSSGEKREILSPFCLEAQQADARAFSRLMRHLREIDGDVHTVIMMQIENEVGLLGDPRDFSPAAEKAFQAPVPAELIDALRRNADQLHPELRAAWRSDRRSGTWSELFGAEAAEVFSAWAFGRYINAVTEAGKAEYPLPMYVNAWLRADGQKAGQYPSGGPIDKVHDVWRAAAPAVDLFAPDIYLPYFKRICRDYVRNGNPLMIPEAHPEAESIGQALYALASCNALCYAPFAVDGIQDGRRLRAGYGFLRQLLPLLVERRAGVDMIGFLQENEGEEECTLAEYRFLIRYNNPIGKGFGAVIRTARDDLLVTGSGFELFFRPGQQGEKAPQILQADELLLVNGELKPRRRLNGDETYSHERIIVPAVTLPGLQPESDRDKSLPPLPKLPTEYTVQRVQLYRP